MKGYRIIAVVWVFFLLLQFELGAQTLPDFSSIGLTLTSETNLEDGRYLVELSDGEEWSCSLVFDDHPSQEIVTRINAVRKLIETWEGLEVRSLHFIYSSQILEAVLIPERLVVDQDDYAPFLPAGISFFYRDFLQFDFRMVKDLISMRIAGRLIDLESLLELMQRAVDNPLAFADKTNYMARLDRLERLVDELFVRNQNLEKELNLARHASLRQFNTGFLCGPDEIPHEAIKQVLELKTERPGLTLSQLRKALKERGVKLSGGEVELVLAYYFNEWDD